MNQIYYICIFVHIICCVLGFIGIKSRILKVDKYMFLIILLLPFWGILSVLILHFRTVMNLDDKLDVDIRKMKIESEAYKSVTIDSKNNTDSIIPLEEALIVNNAKERRELIIDVLNDDPDDYVEVLQKAGNNEDTEVVHYAVTAMVEISKENDFMLQKFDREYRLNPNNYELLTEYSEYLWKCLNQNLFVGQADVVNRNIFTELIKKKIEIKAEKTDYERLIKNLFKLKKYSEVGEEIDNMDLIWHDDEKVILFKLQYFSTLNRADDLKNLVEDVNRKRIYLSPKAKEELAFWNQ